MEAGPLQGPFSHPKCSWHFKLLSQHVFRTCVPGESQPGVAKLLPAPAFTAHVVIIENRCVLLETDEEGHCDMLVLTEPPVHATRSSHAQGQAQGARG